MCVNLEQSGSEMSYTSIGFGSLTTSLPYWPTTRIDRPDGVVTALMVSDVATAPGLRNVATYVDVPSSATLTTAIPAPAGGLGFDSGATETPADPEMYAQCPAHAMFAFSFGRPSTPSGR